MRRKFDRSRQSQSTNVLIPAHRRPRHRAVRPALESIEARTLLSTFIVTTAADNGDDTNPVAGSLREAIIENNADTGNPGVDTIDFNIPGSGLQVIQPQSQLPIITHPVDIDGYTQPGYAGTPLVVLDGAAAGSDATGLSINAGISTVTGLVINDFDFAEISLAGSVELGDGDIIQGNYIGTDPSGNVASGGYEGIAIQSVGNLIGGTSPGAGNLISGNTSGIVIEGGGQNIVEGNRIGTNASGTAAVGNEDGVVLTDYTVANSIGSPASGVGNLISGNSIGIAIAASSNGNVVQNNLIGTDAAGSAPLGNEYGIESTNSTGNTIGGEEYGDGGNLISGNTQDGIFLGVGVSGDSIEGNLIGTDFTGTERLGNGGSGIFLLGAARNNIGGYLPGNSGRTIGSPADDENTIAYNGTPGTSGSGGIVVELSGAIGNSIRGNSIHDNAGLGIDLGGDGVTLNGSHVGQAGPNDWQTFPTLTSVTSAGGTTTISGTLSSVPSTFFELDFFGNSVADPTGFGGGQTYLGTLDGSTIDSSGVRTFANGVETDSSGNLTFTATFPGSVPTGEFVSATATDMATGDTSEFSLSVGVNTAQVSVAVNPSTVSTDLQNAVSTLQSSGSGSTTPLPSINLSVNPSTLSAVVSAVDGLAPNSASSTNPVPIVLNLAPGTYSDTVVTAPAGVRVTINGGGEAVVVGNSPAFELDSGSVLFENLTFSTATDSPTILVTGGSLTVRDCTIQTSTVYAQAAILINGGSVDLGTASSPGGNTINVNGSGEMVHNSTSSSVPDIGNTLEINGTALSAPYLSFTALASSTASSVYGQPVTFTATLRAANPTDGTPSGTVDFFDNTTGTDLGTAPVTNGVATLITQALTAGSHTITADYEGDSNFAFSLDTATQTVQQDATTTALTASAPTPLYGQVETFTATVAPISPGSGTPTGTVTFYDGSTSLGTASLATSGGVTTATLSTAALAVGSHALTAAYGGDSAFAGSTSLDDTAIRNISTVAGTGTLGYSGDGGPAAAAMLNLPVGVAVDAQGDLFIADENNNVVREVRPDGIITTVAGDGTAGYSGDGEPATAAQLNQPTAVAVDEQGDLFIADTRNNVIREVRPDGIITTVAGGGTQLDPDFSGPATDAILNYPLGLAVDAAGDLFIADTGFDVIRELLPNGTLITVAGNGIPGYMGDGGPATAARLDLSYYNPSGVAVDGASDLYIADTGNHVVREVFPDGTITTVAGNGLAPPAYRSATYYATYSGDGGPATAAMLDGPVGVAVDAAGDLFIADTGFDVIREVFPDGTITTVAGTSTFGFNGDGGPATAASLTFPSGIATDGKGVLFIADTGNYRVRWITGTMFMTVRAVATTNTAVVATPDAPLLGQSITLTATITASNPYVALATGTVTFYDGGTVLGSAPLSSGSSPATATLTAVPPLALGSQSIVAVYSGDVGFTESSSSAASLTVQPDSTSTSVVATSTAPVFGQPVTFTATVLPDDQDAGYPTGTVTFYDGSTELGTASLSTSGGATTATLTTAALAVGLHSVSAVYGGDPNFVGSSSWVISTVVGEQAIGGYSGEGYSGDGGLATAAQLNLEEGSDYLSSGAGGGDVAVDAQGDLFIADTGNSVIREVRPNGTITTVAGGGTQSDPDFSGPATAAALYLPYGLAVDAQGDLFIADTGNNVIREVQPDGTITTVAGNGSYGYCGDGGPATAAALASPTAVAVDAQGDLFIADTWNNVIREVQPDGTITTVAGNGTPGSAGDGGPATSATLEHPAGVAVDAQGDLFIADSRARKIREVRPDGIITTLTTIAAAFSFLPGSSGAYTNGEPTNLAVDAQGDLFITDTDDGVILEVQPDGTIIDVAGNSQNFGYWGDGGPPTSAALEYPGGVAVDSAGDVFIADSGNNVIRRVGGLSLTVGPVTTSNLQAALANASQGGSGGSVTLQATSSSAVTTVVQAVNGLTSSNPANPESVTLDLAGATTTPTTPIDTSSGVHVDLTSSSGNATVNGATVNGGTVVVDASVAPVDWTVNGGNVTVEGSATAGDFIVNGGTVTLADGTVITGNSPAITVNGGTVVLRGVTAQTATNSPTIVVNGGSLTIRNSTVEESTGYAQPAILINGGTVDLGNAASPGDNVLNVYGTGELVHNATSNSVPDIGNTLEVNGTPLPSHYLSFTALASSSASSVYGQSVTLTAAVRAANPSDGTPSGVVTFLDTTTGANLGSASVTNGVATLITSALAVGSHTITADYEGNSSFAFSLRTLTQTVQQDNTTTSVTSSASTASFGQAVTFTAKIAANAPGSGTPTGSVDFFDTTTGDDLGSVALSSGKASLSTVCLPVGGNAIKVTYSGDGNFLSCSASTSTITINQSIIVLDPTAGGALSLSGNASIKLAGGVFVDSSSSSAISASGNAQIKASVIDVHGGVQKSGNASFNPAPVTGAATLPDPLALLAEPSTSGLTNYGSESLSGNSSATIKPGIYSQISVSGNASLTLSSCTYIIEGGGLSVSGNANISGSSVMIVNAGSKYPTTDGTYGSITLSGNGSYNLSPPATGTYAGIVMFQSRDNSKALTVSGNASGMTGTVYAPAAQLAESGNAQLNATIVVDTLTVSGNGIANTLTLAAPSGTVAYTPAQIRAAYGISKLSLDGSGQTIAIVDAYDDPSNYQALDAFDSQFGLTGSAPTLYNQHGPASSFLTVLNQYAQATSLPSTDPNGPGTSNWELEEALDVEWAHAIAPAAQIVLVEASSQSLSDLMASVATAASQPGVSVVSMSWGFPEGQAVFASDEATYDKVFTTPGVTFVASTGDYGAADPEYPAFSPNVVAVGGTSLTLNTDGSYNSETGWGYDSDAAGAFIGSGGGISLYEPEPAYQQGVQSTGSRTTPDVSLVADPETGAWIADPYNLDPSNPFEIVGGTSLSAPSWAGLLTLVNQGRRAAGESTLNSSTPTQTQQALYVLPQRDYNVIASGNNGYTAGSGYNLVTGLGTPVANLLVADLVAYQGPGTSYPGPSVGPLQDASLVDPTSAAGGPIDVFSVFDSLTVASNGIGHAGAVGTGSTNRASVRISAPGSRTAGSMRPVAASVQTPTPGSTSQGLMALDRVISNWTPAIHSMMKRLTPLKAGGTVSLDLGRGGILPAMTVGMSSPVLQAGIVDAVVAGDLDIRLLLAGKGQRSPSQKVKPLRG